MLWSSPKVIFGQLLKTKSGHIDYPAAVAAVHCGQRGPPKGDKIDGFGFELVLPFLRLFSLYSCIYFQMRRHYHLDWPPDVQTLQFS